MVMSANTVYWVSHPDCLRHPAPAGHPECPERLHAINDRLLISGLEGVMAHAPAPLATREQLARVHDGAYIDRLLALRDVREAVRLDEDTLVAPGSIDAALRAAGAAAQGTDLVLDGRASLAFCGVRPPGHHAGRAQARGFCFFNNVAVGAGQALARGLERIAILDFDLHYGNGTADIFRNEPRVTLLSTYQHPLYPDWPGLPEAANLIDVPLAAGSGSSDFRNAVTRRWQPVLERVRPQLLFVSAGFDAHHDDPLGDLRLRTDDYAWIGGFIRDQAAEHCDGHVVAVLEGGYELHALARSVEQFLRPFLGGDLLA